MAITPVTVKITYCAECGYERPTLDLAEALMITFTHGLASIQLIPWDEGSFDVRVGDLLVHSMYRDGGFPDHSTIVDAVQDQLSGLA